MGHPQLATWAEINLPEGFALSHHRARSLTPTGIGPMRAIAARGACTIRVDAVWLATELLDMRAGIGSALARVVKVFGGAHPQRALELVKARHFRYSSGTVIMFG